MTTTQPITARQFGAIDEDGRFDLIDGEVIRLSPSMRWHAIVAGRIAFALASYGAQTGYGESPVADGGYLVAHDPDSVLCPDASFIRTEHVTGFGEGKDDWFPFAPDIAVEVLSPSERRRHVERKVALYLAAGAAMVWIVNPRQRRFTVHEPGKPPSLLREGDTLDGGGGLPGFGVAIATIFR